MTTLRLKNYGTRPYHGWLRTTTDHWTDDQTPVPMEAEGVVIVPASVAGFGLRNIDVYCSLSAGEGREIDFDKFVPLPAKVVEQQRQNLLAVVEDVRREHKCDDAQLDGAAIVLRHKINQNENVLFRFGITYPGFTSIVQWEHVAIAHKQSGADHFHDVRDVAEGWAMIGTTLIPDDYALVDTQGLAYVHVEAKVKDVIENPALANNAALLADKQVHAHAWGKLYPGNGVGWPVFRGEAAKWVAEKSWTERRAIAGWAKGTLGTALDLQTTGEQEDQMFVGGEGRYLPGAWVPRYYAALGAFRYPCWTLDLDGNFPPLEPQLSYHRGHPLTRHGSSTQLGRTSWTDRGTGGWANGMDEEHFLFNNTCVAARMSGSPALQLQLRFYAIAWMHMATTEGRGKLTTTGRPGAARSLGYKAYAAWLLYHYLADRDLADQVLERARVWLPQMREAQDRKTIDGWWDVRVNAPSLGTGRKVMVWQQVVGAWGCWKLAKLLGDGELVEWAKNAMGHVARNGWSVDLATDRLRPVYWFDVDEQSMTFGSSDWTHFAFPLIHAAAGDYPDELKSLWINNNPDRPDPCQPCKWVDPTVLTEQQWEEAANG